MSLVEGLSPDFAASSVETLYQPIVRLSDRVPVAVETLARLRHPDRGVLLPEAFLPEVERSGQSCELTNVVVARALTDVPALGAGLDIAVNVMLDVLVMPDCLRRLNAIVREARVAPARIIVELTESRPVADLAVLAARVTEMREAGYQVAIDDFSPTMANGAALLELPFSQLKFDHCLTAAGARPGPHAAFMDGAVDAAHARGMIVVAEGVETEADWLRLRAMGVDAAQGFWIAQPLPAGEIDSWSAGWRGA